MDEGSVEIVGLGERAVLYSPVTGAVVLTNALGRDLATALATSSLDPLVQRTAEATGHDAPDVRAEFDELLRQWASSGLLDRQRRPFPRVVPHRKLRGDVRVLHIAHHGVGLTIRSEAQDVAARVASTLGTYLAQECPSPAAVIDILREAHGITVFRDGEPLWNTADADTARFLALQAAISILAGEAEVGAIVHGALVARNGQGLLIAGPSGRGKTTLALALAERGWSYASDDLVVLHRSGRHAVPIRMAAHRKPGSHAGRSCDAGYVLPVSRLESAQPIPVVGVVLPEFLPPRGLPVRNQPEWETTLLPPEETLTRLLKSGTEVSRSVGSIHPLAELVTSVPCWSTRYVRTEDAMALCAYVLGLPGVLTPSLHEEPVTC